jgi:hypothetical protein
MFFMYKRRPSSRAGVVEILSVAAITALSLRSTRRVGWFSHRAVRFAAEAGFGDLVRFILGDTGVPYDWEYGDHAGKS